MKRVRRFVSPPELAYYQGHFREAIREDAVVCLECGGLLRDLRNHLAKAHAMLSDAYRDRWGYNRTTALNIPAVSELHRQRALERNLPALVPKGSIYKAQEAQRRFGVPPHRREYRLNMSDRVRARLAAGWRAAPRKIGDDVLTKLAREKLSLRQIAAKTGYSKEVIRRRLHALGLMEPPRPPLSNSELLALLEQGLWPKQIAAKTMRTQSAITKRMRELRQRGVPVPRPAGLRPNAKRKVTDDQIIALARTGLRLKEVARKAGIAVGSVHRRLRAIRRRGLLPPSTHM